MTYRNLLERINGGASVICIDVRDRKEEEKEIKEEEKLEEWLQEQLNKEYKKTIKNLDGCENLDCCMLAYLKKLLDVYKTYQDPKKTGEKKKMFPLPFLGGDTAEKKHTTLQKAIQILEEKERENRNQTSSHSEIDINYVKCANLFAWEFFRNLPLPEDHSSEKEGDEHIRDFFS